MNKKILSTAVGIALAGSVAVAQADVTVFGMIDVSIDAWDQDGGSDDVTMESNTSDIGVKGSEDLGNGMSAIFKADFQFNATERNRGGITDRDQWVGLKGGFGKVRFGTISTSYKSHGAMIDPMYRTSLQGRGASNAVGGLQSGLHSGAGENGGRMTNHIRYDSADYNGLGFTVDYSLDQANDEEDAWGIGGHYQNGGLLAYADYIANQADVPGHDSDAWKLGGSYDFGNNMAVYGQWESDGGLIAGSDDGDIWHLGGSFTMGNTMLYAAFGQGKDLGGSGNDYDAWTLAVKHNMSKRTMMYAGFNQVDDDNTGETDVFSVGMRHKF